MAQPAGITTVRQTIARDLGQEIPGNGVVKVAETSMLAIDLQEYVLTSQLAADYGKVLERVIEAARPATVPADRVGVWVSGFFGSGKSHFAKLAGHLLADTPTPAGTTRELFARHLRTDRPQDERVAELLQQAQAYRLGAHVVPFDIASSQGTDEHVGLIFLRAFYKSLDLSPILSFAVRELDLQKVGKYDALLETYEARTGIPWTEDRELVGSDTALAACLAELLPERYPTVELAHASLQLAFDELGHASITDVVGRFSSWARQRSEEAHEPRFLVFVADEVGAWAGRRLKRIEEVRALVEGFVAQGEGRLWLLATSQERLSEVISNSPDLDSPREAEELLQRLEARYPVNIHLESSEVGTVIEDRILAKRPVERPALEALWDSKRGTLVDIAEPPGIEMRGRYPAAERDAFVRDYPFLPYQLPAAADIFGSMRGVKVSSGARSMLKVALDAAAAVADRPLGAIVSWDQIFDSANRGNEFADEHYLGSQGLEYLAQADRDLADRLPIERPSRVLKVLWLLQQTGRIPRTVSNLTRLLVGDLATDVLALERAVAQTLEVLGSRSYVRKDPASAEWRFLTPDEVTVEKIVARIAEQDVRETDVRRERQALVGERITRTLTGRLTMGTTNTDFRYGVSLNDAVVLNDDAPVQLHVYFSETAAASRVAEQYAAYLASPEIYWLIQPPARLDDRLRRALAIARLATDEEFQRIATQKTKEEARKLETEALQLAADASTDVDQVLSEGTLYWGGGTLALSALNGQAKARIDEAIRDRLSLVFDRFKDGDRAFNANNIDRLCLVPPAERAALDPALSLFDAEGHVFGSHPAVEALSAYLNSTTKNEGQEATAYFRARPYGWPPDLIRYVAAAMFADGKLSVIDRTGRRYDNPKDASARAQFGTGAFRSVRLEIEEHPLTPEEITALRELLADLGRPTKDAAEVTIAEAGDDVRSTLSARLAVVMQAEQAGLPLPATYAAINPMLMEIATAGSRVKRMRAMLLHGPELRAATAALEALESFTKRAGLAQYARSRRLLDAAVAAGLEHDSDWGATVTEAREQLDAIIDQRRVLEDWDGAYREQRELLIQAFKAVYLPLRDDVRHQTEAARAAVLDSPEFAALHTDRALKVRLVFLADGRPLAEIPEAELKSDADLLVANDAFSIAHLRTKAAALPGQLGLAQGMVIEQLSEQQTADGAKSTVASWDAKAAFGGATFRTEAEVTDAFATAADQVKALIREGKSVKVV